jgi:hypothetical protein
MASKLFRAVVGVGISLGSVSACGGSTSNDFEQLVPPDAPAAPEGGVDAGAPPRTVDAAAVDAAPASDGGIDTGPIDAAPVDAAADAPGDAIVAAFCDVTWPITKAGREVCGPADECAGQPIPWCFGPGDQGPCTLYPLECVGGEWHCMGGVTPTTDPWGDPKCQ